ncbi:hypothetical protein HanRHA438_Chr09g0427931 [Helianthus annuus]|nr:hypothetical protein HanRHA438_Chr09g0427911 [Helianthus annuus]KAJ0890806.1 hypothetical protein HanRHA438_Chr09g0427931 [Helianthus annuus]
MRKTSGGLFEGTWGARKHIFCIIFSLESLGNNLCIIFLSLLVELVNFGLISILS